MAGQPSTFEREVRDTVLKSGFTGVAATVIAVAAFSPAGFGDWIGASVASSLGLDTSANAADNPYANLPAYPAPLSQAELDTIRSQLASSEASLTLLRAATDDKIEHVRTLALNDGMVTFTPTRRTAAPVAQQDLRLTLSEPAALASGVMSEAPVEAYVIESAPVEASAAPASYAGVLTPASYRDPHLELADLLLAHETY
jgi:hypothetical protein